MSFLAPPRHDRKRGRDDHAPGAERQPQRLSAPADGGGVDLYVLGVSATIHSAGDVCLEDLLHSWSGDVCVTIDRFDVRALLDSWAPPPPERRWSAHQEEDSTALDEERYSDLRLAEQKEREGVHLSISDGVCPIVHASPSLSTEEAAAKRIKEANDVAATGAFNRVGFTYGATEEPGGTVVPLPPPPPLERYVPPFALPVRMANCGLS